MDQTHALAQIITQMESLPQTQGTSQVLAQLQAFSLVPIPHPIVGATIERPSFYIWADGLWTQLSFAMQMSLMVVVCATTSNSHSKPKAPPVDEFHGRCLIF